MKKKNLWISFVIVVAVIACLIFVAVDDNKDKHSDTDKQAFSVDLKKLKETMPANFIYPDSDTAIENIDFLNGAVAFTYETNESIEDLSKKYQKYLIDNGYQYDVTANEMPATLLQAKGSNGEAMLIMIADPKDGRNTVLISFVGAPIIP